MTEGTMKFNPIATYSEILPLNKCGEVKLAAAALLFNSLVQQQYGRLMHARMRHTYEDEIRSLVCQALECFGDEEDFTPDAAQRINKCLDGLGWDLAQLLTGINGEYKVREIYTQEASHGLQALTSLLQKAAFE